MIAGLVIDGSLVEAEVRGASPANAVGETDKLNFQCCQRKTPERRGSGEWRERSTGSVN